MQVVVATMSHVPDAGKKGDYLRIPISKESLINSSFDVPAQAGTQAIQAFLDARMRGHDGFSEVS